ncbi:hypothetical protein T440DRAFT_87528 [Plenodomus tracheiphilus IPT5]|uniref:Uncharacterized protein n=1 Tax=Plenodomus tracheiphilus IPT5 TaxID=1408161 RepID=A0A6A7B6P4_9PLEO|nr:hypothetical protein T440DRAFT_87528 [Plenodomus tracheiphilus IPT5]
MMAKQNAKTHTHTHTHFTIKKCLQRCRYSNLSFSSLLILISTRLYILSSLHSKVTYMEERYSTRGTYVLSSHNSTKTYRGYQTKKPRTKTVRSRKKMGKTKKGSNLPWDPVRSVTRPPL